MANPQKDEVLAALRAADAAGDTEAAQRLALIYQGIPEVVEVDVPASGFPSSDPLSGLVQDGDTFRQPTAGENAKKSGMFLAGSLARGLGDLGVVAKNTFQGDPLGLLDFIAPNEKDSAANHKISNYLSDAIGAPKPETAGERILDTGVRGAVGGGIFGKASGTGRFLREALIGGAGGTGAQAAGEATAGSPLQLPAMLAGGLAGGLGMAGLSEIGPRPLRDTLAGTVTEEMREPLRASGAAAREARASGVSLNTLDPYAGPGNPLTDLQDNLVQSGGGDRIAANIRKQGPQINKLANDTVAALPGQVVTKQTVANQIGRASTGAQRDMQKAATDGFDAELRAVKERQLAAAEREANATGTELQARAEDVTTSAKGGGRMVKEDFTDRARAAKDAERRDQLAAGREVSNPTGFNIDELGNYGTMLAARRVREGKDPRASYSAEDLLDAGLTAQEVRALVAGRQPVTKGTGAMQGDYSPGAPGRVGAAGEEIIQRAQKDYLDAAEAHENALAKIATIDQLSADATTAARSRINSMIADQRGNQQMVDDLIAIRDGFADLRTTKELHNYIVSVRHQLPSAKLNSRPADISEGSVLGAAIAPLKQLRNEITPAYAAADDAYKAAKAGIAKVHDETDIGKLTPKSGTYADGEASAGAVFKLLQDGESPNATDNRLKKSLLVVGQKDPAALSNAVKSYLDNLMGEVFGKEATGRPTAKPGTKLTAALGSASEPQNSARMNALRIAIDAVADVNKLPTSERQAMHRGLDHLRDIANANARTPNRPTSINMRELAEVAGELRGLAALRLLSLNAGNQFYRWLKLRTQKKTFDQLDKLFSDPSAANIETLIELGKVPKMSRRKSALLSTLIGMSQTDAVPEE